MQNEKEFSYIGSDDRRYLILITPIGKSQRADIYKAAANLLHTGAQDYCCPAVKSFLPANVKSFIADMVYYIRDISEVPRLYGSILEFLLPEFYNNRPDDIDPHQRWWLLSERQKRIDYLLMCADLALQSPE